MSRTDRDAGRDRDPGPRIVPLPADRMPPRNLEAEEGVLGSVLLDPACYDDVAEAVAPDDFSLDVHRTIAAAMRALADRGEPIDVIALADELRRGGRFDDGLGLARPAAGDRVGFDDLHRLLENTPHAANGRYYAGLVRQKAVKRRLIEAAHETLRDCYADEDDAASVVQAAEQRVFAVGEGLAGGSALVSAGDAAAEGLERARLAGEGLTSGIGTGLSRLDDLTGGMHPEAVTIVAARPAMGKTSLALRACEHAALEQRLSVLLVSLEMGCAELGQRLAFGRAGVDHRRYVRGDRTDGDIVALRRVQAELAAAQLAIDEGPTRTVAAVASIARRHKRRAGLDLLVLDYLQLIDPGEGRRGDSRNDEVARISRRLKALAKELRVPVLVLSQLSRKPEERRDHRPLLSDLRDSGAIEQDADVVVFLHRPGYYDPNDRAGVAELIVAKNRNGPTATVEAAWLPGLVRLADLDPYARQDPGINPHGDDPF